MVVLDKAKYNFAYVLPKLTNDKELMIVIPSALQMGWKHSPPCFYAASKTAQDVMEDLLYSKYGPLPPHRLLEEQLLPENVPLDLNFRVDWSTTNNLPANWARITCSASLYYQRMFCEILTLE